MKNETLNKKLKSILDESSKERKNEELKKIIQKLSEDITSEQFKKTNDKTRFNYVKSYLKKIKETKHVLKFIKDENKIQIFTDTYSLFHLRSDLMFKPLPEYINFDANKPNYDYPDTFNIMNKARTGNNLTYSIEGFKLAKALNDAGRFVSFELSFNLYVVFDKKTLKDAFKILKYKSGDVFSFKTKDKTFNNSGLDIITVPAYIKRKDSEALIMPIRANSDDLNFLSDGQVFTYNELKESKL